MSDKKYDLNDPDRVTYIGLADFRGGEQRFGIKAKDRTRHTYVIGKTGMGKSTLLENMAIQDIQNGEGLCFIDPHGSSAEKLLRYVPEHRIKDVVYFSPFDSKYPVALNILEHVDEDHRHLVASGLMDAFKKVFGEDQFSGRMVYLLLNAILSLLENEGESLMGINRIFSDKDYRKKIIANVKDPAVLAFWNNEFAKYTEKYVQEATPAIQNKIGQFISNPIIRNIVGQKKTSFDIREIMDQRKILICNLSIGLTGKENVDLIGSLLITKIYLAAMSRADLNESEMRNAPPFYFYVDEFQNFVNESFAEILSQARKYNLALTIAHQYIEQLDDSVKAAVFGNVGTMITFRVGATDAEILEKEFAPKFTMDDIVNLSARQIYLRLSIDGAGSKPFSAKTIPPIDLPSDDYSVAAIACSRGVYGKTKAQVEEEISKWYEPIFVPAPAKSPSANPAYPKSDSAPAPKSYPQTFPKQDFAKPTYSQPSNPRQPRPAQTFSQPATPISYPKTEQRGVIEPGVKKEVPQERKTEMVHDRKIETKAENTKPYTASIEKPITNKPNNSLRDALNVALGVDLKKKPENKDHKTRDVTEQNLKDKKPQTSSNQIKDSDIKNLLEQ